MEDETMDNQFLENNEDEKNSAKRDAFLKRYQGIILSSENLCAKTLIEVKRGIERNSFHAQNGHFRSNFFRVAAVNTANLYDIRHKNFDTLRQSHQYRKVDNFNYFCKFFGIENYQGQADPDYETLLKGFKTMYPNYVLQNENI